LLKISTASSGGDLLLFLFGVLWVGDTAAMGVGKWLGRHKLAPAVSPNKTVEGFIGGFVGALAVGLLMAFWKFGQLPLYHVLFMALGCSLFGQLGDLVESMWKRSLGIKDSSDIIPGHGGVLDRFDSLLFAAPFMYGYLVWLVG
jgi:phosphatidate cytidylyltransferase